MEKYNRNSYDIELEKLLDQNKATTLADFEASYHKQELALEEFITAIAFADKNNLSDIRLLLNTSGFINVISYDLKIICSDLMFSKGEWHRRVYARQACLIIYESINDLFDLLGKDFKDLTKNRLDITEFQNNLKDVKKDLSIFKSTYFKDLQTIRNVATAHRSNEVLNQIEVIYQINWSKSLNIIKEFSDIINPLANTLMKIINKAINELPELKDLKNSL